MSDPLIRVVCRLQKSTYDEERIFRIEVQEGSEYVGIAPTEYCHDAHGADLGADVPESGQIVEGMVDARLVRNGGHTAWVSLPSGETILVPGASIRHRAAPEPRNVLVRP